MVEKETRLETLLVTEEDGLATITLNRPQAMNTINDTMASEIRQIMETLGSDDRIRAILLRATGRAFCAGYEISGQWQHDFSEFLFVVKERVAAMNDVYLAILNMEKPVIGAVNGVATGGGFALVLSCDIAIASDAARFSVVYARRGLVPDVGINYLLPRTVGLRKAKELIFTADMIDAKEAERIGLVNRVVPADSLDEEATTLAKRLASGATKAIGLSKAIIHRGLGTDLASTMELESWGQALCIQSKDFQEGVNAFLEKRQPDFKGK